MGKRYLRRFGITNARSIQCIKFPATTTCETPNLKLIEHGDDIV